MAAYMADLGVDCQAVVCIRGRVAVCILVQGADCIRVLAVEFIQVRRVRTGYKGPWGPCITGALGKRWISEHCPS